MTARFTRLLLVSLCVCAVAAQQFAQGVRDCRTKHVGNLNQCLINVIKQVQPLLGKGLPEINLPPMEPILLRNIQFRQSIPPVTINGNFSNVRVYGFTAFDLKYLNIDLVTTRKLNLGMIIPSMTITGQYEIGGNMFVLPIRGNGNVLIKLDGVIAESTGDIVREGSKVFLRNVNIGFKIQTMKTRLDNLLPGNQRLSNTIHYLINENTDLVLDEIRPAISSQLDGFIEGIFNSIFSALPADILNELPRNQRA